MPSYISRLICMQEHKDLCDQPCCCHGLVKKSIPTLSHSFFNTGVQERSIDASSYTSYTLFFQLD